MSHQETEHIDTAAFLRFNDHITAVRKIIEGVQNSVYETMAYPVEPRDKMIAFSTLNNVFDRIDEALQEYLSDEARALMTTSRENQDEKQPENARTEAS